MIIDCHGHYTTAPDPHQDYRAAQLARLEDPSLPEPQSAVISDDQIRESIELNQLKLLRERGADMTIFSPRASTMAHHVGDEQVSQAWTIACNDLINRVVELFPEQFIGVCQLPQSPGVPVKNSIAELERCVTQLGFVGCNLNPDPSGGHWTAPPLTDRHWYPFFERTFIILTISSSYLIFFSSIKYFPLPGLLFIVPSLSIKIIFFGFKNFFVLRSLFVSPILQYKSS